jgi:hypothetical protein
MTTKNYNITYSDNTLVVTMKRKPNWLILPMTGLWILGWIGILLTIIYGLITDSDKLDGEIILFMTFSFFTGLFVLRIFLWHLSGVEKITIDNKELRIEKLGTILTIPSKFEIEQIEYISNTERPPTPRWIKFWGLGGGQIEFVYLGQTKYFGQSLTFEEATKIIESMKEKLKNTTR